MKTIFETAVSHGRAGAPHAAQSGVDLEAAHGENHQRTREGAGLIARLHTTAN